MENSESCGFVLRTSDIVDSSGSSLGNGNGIKNDAYGASYTWYNINMKQILGSMWDDYEFFSLSLIAVPMSTLNASALQGHDKFATLYLKGLQWDNCNFSHVTKTNNIKTCIGFITMVGITTTVPGVDEQAEVISNCFSKSNATMDLTIDLNSIISDILSVPANSTLGCIYPQMNFIFSINPVKKTERFANIYLRSIGDSVQVGTQRTWKMYNLKQSLGSLWDDYDTFNICLTEAYGTTFSAPLAGDNITAIVNLSGLPFIYPAQMNANVGILDLSVTSSAGSKIKNYANNIQTFTKYFPIVDLVISLNQLTSDSQISTVSGSLNSLNYIFKVTGVNSFAK